MSKMDKAIINIPAQMKKDLIKLAEILNEERPYEGKITMSDLIREQCLKLLQENKDKLEKHKDKQEDN